MTTCADGRTRLVNALTFDVEDWFHGFGLPSSSWGGLEARLPTGLQRILDLLDAHQVRATFFVLGALVERWQGLLGLVADAGHEIATHGYWHTPVYDMTPTDFACDLQKALQALRSITVQPVIGYRAPFFSITVHSLWALPLLTKAGIRYDSSVVPAHNPRYGIPRAHRFPHSMSTDNEEVPGAVWDTEQDHPAAPSGLLLEFPISTVRLGRLTLPFGGGFYARLLPYRLIRQAIGRHNAWGNPVVFYFHPWELDPDHPRITDGVPALYRFTHYYKLGHTARKLEALLHDFAWGPLSEVEEAHAEDRLRRVEF